MKCPNCNGRCIGRVGNEQYYCWDCCVEFNVSKGMVRIYHLDADGEMIAAATHPTDGSAAHLSPAMQRG